MKTFWSFSSLLDYERCPHTQSFPYSARPAQEKNEAAERGIAIHDQCYQYARGLSSEHPEGNFPWETLRWGVPEEKIGMDNEWQPIDYKDAWFKFIPDNYRVSGNSVTLIDFKTGKREFNEVKHTQQTQLYAAAICAKLPSIEEVKTELWYLDQDLLISAAYNAQKARAKLPRFKKRADKMLADKLLEPNPTKSNCKFCVFNSVCAYAYRD